MKIVRDMAMMTIGGISVLAYQKYNKAIMKAVEDMAQEMSM